MTKKQDKSIFKFSLLSISLITGLASVISPALPLMYKAFPTISHSGVETLTTLPSFGLVLGLLINPLLVKYLHTKKTVIFGIVLALVAGVFPVFSNNYYAVFISRFLLGLGLGSFSSLASSLLPYFYKNDKAELAKMTGYQSVMPNIASAFCSFGISYLLTLGWHAPFWVYALAIIPLIFFPIFVNFDKDNPDPATQKVTKNKVDKKVKYLTPTVITIALLISLIFLFYMPVAYKVPALIVQEKIGSINEYSVLLGALTIIGIPVGASFGALYKRLGFRILPISIFMVLLGMVIICFATNFIEVIISSLFLSLGFTLVIPIIYNWMYNSTSIEAINIVVIIVSVLMNLAQAISPMVINFLTGFAKSDSPKMSIIISTVCFSLIFIWSVFIYVRNKNKAGV